MLRSIILIVSFALVEETCFAKITIETPKQSQLTLQLIDATVQVLSSCYGKRASIIGVLGDPTGILFGALLSKQDLPVISIDSQSNVSRNGSLGHGSRHKLQVFAITAKSTTQLEEDLKKMKNSLWWNHMASIFILDWVTETDNGCSNAFEYLWQAWRINLINANYLCINKTNKVLMYNYNPYTSKAPIGLKLEKIFKGYSDHPWSMFVQEYQEDKDICEGFYFDKTTDLGGYMVSSIVQRDNIFWKTSRYETGINGFRGLDGRMAQIYLHAMNATVTITNHDDEVFINRNAKGEIIGLIVNLIKGLNDISLISYYQKSLINQTAVTYPYWSSGVGVVTKYRDPLSQLGKLTFVVTKSSRYCLYFLLLTTILFYKFFIRQPLASSILDTLRFACNCGHVTVPKMISARIFLGFLFFIQITFLPHFPARLAYLQTYGVTLRNVDTLQGLIASRNDYKIYADNRLDSVLENSNLARIIDSRDDNINCTEYVLNNPSVACVQDWDVLTVDAMDPKLHLSREPIIQSYIVLAMRDDWPPEQRFNEILMRLAEANIVPRTYNKYSESVLKVNKFNENKRRETQWRATSLSQLSFAFAILGIGLLCATAALVVEIIIAKSSC